MADISSMVKELSEWFFWLNKPFIKPILGEPRIPRKYWVDENNNRLYPEEKEQSIRD